MTEELLDHCVIKYTLQSQLAESLHFVLFGFVVFLIFWPSAFSTGPK